MGLFGGSPQKTQSTTVPWTAAQPYIKTGMAGAQNLLNTKSGYNAPTFQTYVPQSAATQAALTGEMGVAQQGNPLAQQSMDAVSSNFAGGASYNQLQDLYNQSSNPAFAGMVDTQANKLQTQLNEPWSGMGRYGSAAQTNDIATQVGDYREKATADNWNQNIANQRGILGDINANQMSAIAAAPGAYEQQYAPYTHMAQVGAANEDLATRQLQAKLDRYNTNQQAPWNRLNAYNSAINGASNGYQSTTGTVTPPTNPFGGLLGGALAGGQIGGVGGAVGGGLLGLLSNLG